MVAFAILRNFVQVMAFQGWPMPAIPTMPVVGPAEYPSGDCFIPDRPIGPHIPNQEDANRAADDQRSEADLKFVAVNLGEETVGGWYRELPDAQIEVLSRAQLERVALHTADAETKARETITEILGRRSRPSRTGE